MRPLIAGLTIILACASIAGADTISVPDFHRYEWDPATLTEKAGKKVFRIFVDPGMLPPADVNRLLKAAAEEWMTFGDSAYPASGQEGNPQNGGMKEGKAGGAAITDNVMNGGSLWDRKKLYEDGATSRSFSADEKKLIADRYAAKFPNGVTVEVTNDPAAKATAEITIRFADRPNQVNKNADGSPDFANGNFAEGSTLPVRSPTNKSQMKKADMVVDSNPTLEDFGRPPATVKAKTWFFASDTDGDGKITNKDKKPDPTKGEVDLYSVLKHELGHAFTMEHTTTAQRKEPPKQYNGTNQMDRGANAPDKSVGPTRNPRGDLASRDIEIYFASDRAGGFGRLDLWSLAFNGTTWSAPKNLGASVNTAADETMPYVSKDGTLLFFSSNRGSSFDLFLSEFNVDLVDWTAPAAVPGATNTAATETSPTLDERTGRLLFASNRPGGAGGFDIWGSPFVSGLEWGAPSNLGIGINTPHNEIDPGFSPFETHLYFSSDRPGGAGGFDIWALSLDDAGAFYSLRNMREANSVFDDVSPRISVDAETMYLARSDASGNLNLRTSEAVSEPPSPLLLLVLVVVLVGSARQFASRATKRIPWQPSRCATQETGVVWERGRKRRDGLPKATRGRS